MQFYTILSCLIILLNLLLTSGINTYRLPNSSQPTNYEIRLEVDPTEADFYSGITTITVKVLEPTEKLTIHADGLFDVKVYLLDDELDIYDNHTLNSDDTHFLTIYTKKTLDISKRYDLIIEYKARFGETDGLYLTTYTESGEIKTAAATQLAPVSARKMFPCYDEPAFKATFSFKIKTPDLYTVTSNMNIMETRSDSNGFQETVFENTPIMSTYVLGLVISEFNYRSSAMSEKEFRVYARSEKLPGADFALQVGPGSLKELETYLNQSYIIPKLDKVALNKFKFSAMENWGIVIYHEDYLLHKPEPSIDTIQTIATVVCHENTHMWFGNEVTHSWWGYVWLKEGFATYFQHLIMDILYDEEWRMMDQFVVSSLQRVMYADSFPSTHPLSSMVSTPAEISANYDSVAYIKSACVLRMMSHVLGEETFKRGVQNYVKNGLRSTATPEYLFEQMQMSIRDPELLPQGLNVSVIFSTWTDQAAYPVIYATRVSPMFIELKQERYYRNASLTSTEQWWVPYSIVTESNIDFSKTTPDDWLEPGKRQFVNIDESEKWFLLNPQQTGYYRVMYDEHNWSKLIEVMNSPNFTLIHPLNRAQLIDDAVEFLRSKIMSSRMVLDLLVYLRQEDDFIPWKTARRVIWQVSMTMKNSNYARRLNEFFSALVKKFYRSVNLRVNSNDNHSTKLKRVLALEIANDLKLREFVDELDIISQLLSSKNHSIEDVHPDIRHFVYCHEIRKGHLTWNVLWTEYTMETSRLEKQMLIKAMACFENEEKRLYLLMSMENQTRDVDRVAILENLLSTNVSNFGLVLDFLTENFDRLIEKLSSPSHLISIFDMFADGINSDEYISKFKHFVQIHKDKFDIGLGKTVERTIDSMRLNKEWREYSINNLEAWLTLRS